jgi:hypothetical protein
MLKFLPGFRSTKINGRPLRSLALSLLLAACRQENEFSNLELKDFVYAYQNKGLFQKHDQGWHGFKHAGAERGIRFFPYADEPDKAVELYEFISIRERERSDRELETYARQRDLPYDPNASLNISRFSLYGYQQFSSQRQKQIVEVFQSILGRR